VTLLDLNVGEGRRESALARWPPPNAGARSNCDVYAPARALLLVREARPAAQLEEADQGSDVLPSLVFRYGRA
jgi:hypothetical protein